MPKNRVQVNPLAGPVPLTPRAAPVDTFHRPDEVPQNEGPDQMAQLTAALGQVAPALFRAGDLQHAEQTAKQMSEGELAILADKKLQNRKALRDAVANGQIPAARNPWFYQGMRQQVYRIEGEKFDSALRDAYAQSDARNEGDISDFLGGFTSKYMESIGADANDPEVARILTPAVERSQAHLLDVHRTEREHAIQETVEQNTGVEIGQILDHMDDSNSQGKPEFYAKTIHGLIEEQYKNGLDGTRSNEIVASAVARKAVEKLDTSYLNILDEIPSGPDGKSRLAQVGYVRDLRRKTEESIYHALEENDRVSSKRAKDEKDTAVGSLQTKIFNTLLSAPGTDIKGDLRLLSQYDPDAAQKAYGWQQSQINGVDNVVEDPVVVVSLTAKTFSGEGSLSEIMDAMRQGSITKQTATKLAENIERSKEFRSTLRDSTVQELYKSLGQAVRGSDATFKESDAINATRAQNDFLQYLINYKKSNPTASEGDVLKYGVEIQKTLLGIYAAPAVEGAKVQVDSKTAFIADPEAVDWEQSPIFKPDELTKASIEYNQTKGTSGVIAKLAARLGIPASELYQAQLLLAKPKPKTK